MSEFNQANFRTNLPNIPKLEEFERSVEQSERRKVEQEEFRQIEVVGPVLPQVNYSEEEDVEEDDEVSDQGDQTDDGRFDYEPPPYKQFKYNRAESSSEEEDYVDPSIVAKDPALAHVLQERAKILRPARTKTHGSIQFEKPEFQKVEGVELPITHELVLKGHTRAITSLAFDNSGSRLCSGSYDYQARLWDFAGMDKTMHAFRVIDPFEGHPVCQVSWSKDGKHVLCICGHAQSYLMDREGKRIVETLKGDMYLTDMYQTHGHIAVINAGQFHPDSNDHFLTASDDGTVRLFNMNQKLWGICQHLPHKEIVKCFDIKGLKTVPIQIGVRQGSDLCLTGCRDGSIQVFQLRNDCLGINRRPQLIFREAHRFNENINSIKILEGGQYFISNSTDDTIKLWDIRNPSHYVNVQYFHSNFSPSTKMGLNREETLLVTADHHFNKMQKLEKPTDVVFYHTKTLEEYARFPACETPVTDVVWHPVLNQIFLAGMDGEIRGLFNPHVSQKGCMLCINRKVKHLHAEMIEYQREIIAPQAVALFKEFQVREMTKLIIKKDDEQFKSFKPEMPLTGPGKGGKIAGPGTVTQFVMRNLYEAPIQEDARQALLKLDPETRSNPKYVQNAYKLNQPQTIFDTTTPYPEQNFILAHLKVVCKHCGMKICACHRKVVP